MIRVRTNSFRLDDDIVDRWAHADRYGLFQCLVRNLDFAKTRKGREKFYKILEGGTAAGKAVRQVELALSGRTPPGEIELRISTAVRRKIEEVSNGAKAKKVHLHFETSIDYYQERDEGLVPVYRKMDQARFIEATARGRPGTVTPSEKRAIEQWADEFVPVLWPTLPPVEELERAAKCIGMSRQSWRGKFFGGVEDELYRALFWQGAPLKQYAGTAANLIHPSPRELMKTYRLFPGRLAVVAVIVANGFSQYGGTHYEGSLWELNRLLPLDARRWLNVQYDWCTPGKIPHPAWVRDSLAADHNRVREWLSHPTSYPAAYNCDPVQLWQVLEQSAWFWCAFIDVISGRGWGGSQAARFIRGEI